MQIQLSSFSFSTCFCHKNTSNFSQSQTKANNKPCEMFDYKDNLFIYTNRKKKVTNFRKYYLYLQKISCMKKYFIIFLFLAYTVVNYSQIINPQYDRGWFELFHPHIDKVELTISLLSSSFELLPRPSSS